jgi:HK97 family phage major capsid protein
LEKKVDEKVFKELLDKYGAENEAKIKEVLAQYGSTLTSDILKSVEEKLEAKLAQAFTKAEPIAGNVIKEEMGFKGLFDFASSVAKRDSGRLEKLSTSTTGEYIIPQGYASEILKVAMDSANLWSKTRSFQVAGNSLSIPYRVDKNHTSGSLMGGATIYWTEAAGTITATDFKFGKVQLKLNKLAGLIPAENEFIEDSPLGVNVMVRDVFGELAGFELDKVAIKGTGAGQPLGIYNSPALLTVTKKSGQAAATVVADNIFKMYTKLPSLSKGRAVWVYSPEVMPQLLSMTVGDFPVFLPGNNVFGRPTDTILGMPAFESEHCEALGTKGDIY